MDNQNMNNNNRPDDQHEGGNKKDDMNKQSLLVMVVIAVIVMIAVQLLSGKIAAASQEEVTYTEFLQAVEDGKVEEVEFASDRINFMEKDNKSVMYYTGNVETKTVFEKSDVQIWECRNCGHIVVGTKAPEVCPVCKHPQSYFEVKKENY